MGSNAGFKTEITEYTELEILQDQVAKYRTWHRDVMNMKSSKEPGTKLMLSYRNLIVRPPEAFSMTNIEHLEQEISGWNSSIYELAWKFKSPGNIAFSNIDGIIHKMGQPYEYLNKFILTPEKPIGMQVLFPPAAAFYVAVGDRVRCRKGSKGKIGSIASVKEDNGTAVAVQWDGIEELDRGVWCGKSNKFSLVYALEK